MSYKHVWNCLHVTNVGLERDELVAFYKHDVQGHRASQPLVDFMAFVGCNLGKTQVDVAPTLKQSVHRVAYFQFFPAAVCLTLSHNFASVSSFV